MGGALYVESTQLTLDNVQFRSSRASGGNGGVWSRNNRVALEDSPEAIVPGLLRWPGWRMVRERVSRWFWWWRRRWWVRQPKPNLR